MNISETSSSPLLFIVKLLKLSDNLSQPNTVRGSTSVHSKVCRFLKESNGRQFSFGGSLASSAIIFGPGAVRTSAGNLVKLLYIYLSSVSIVRVSGRPH